MDHIDDLLAFLRADAAWLQLFQHHGIDLNADNLCAEFLRPLEGIDRTLPGFEDFCASGCRAIEPNSPARSLLYHAIASPAVTSFLGRPLAGPSLEHLDALENYIFGVDPPSLLDLWSRHNTNLAICMFAYEYRAADGTPHRKHADLCYSRTAISRLGIVEPVYDASSRGYLGWDKQKAAIPVLPCRIGAFLSLGVRGADLDVTPLRNQSDEDGADAQRLFWIPVHKLFQTGVCLQGLAPLKLELEMLHVNEKLRRIHLALMAGGTPTQFDEAAFRKRPFRIDDDLCTHRPVGSSILLTPVRRDTLVEAVPQQKPPFGFPVIPNREHSGSYRLPSRASDARSAPEFVDARTRVDGAQSPLDTPKMIKDGDYSALHHIDHTADGFVRMRCDALAAFGITSLPAYSIVAAPDFLPRVSQQEVSDWFREGVRPSLKPLIWPIDVLPSPLSDERKPANLTLLDKNSKRVFSEDDDTVTAVVCSRVKPKHPFDGQRKALRCSPRPAPLRSSGLPDNASGLFAPGWDVSKDRVETAARPNGITFLAAYGLGSPFLEDSRVCAALSAFWPAASPDTSRSFALGKFPAVTPLTDEEIGIGDTASWDGTQPIEIGETKVRFLFFPFVDYIRPLDPKRFNLSRLFEIDSREFISRTHAMARVYEFLQVTPEERRNYALLEFRYAQEEDLSHARLASGGAPAYKLKLAHINQDHLAKVPEGDPRFRAFNRNPKTELDVIISLAEIATRKPGSQWQKTSSS